MSFENGINGFASTDRNLLSTEGKIHIAEQAKDTIQNLFGSELGIDYSIFQDIGSYIGEEILVLSGDEYTSALKGFKSRINTDKYSGTINGLPTRIKRNNDRFIHSQPFDGYKFTIYNGKVDDGDAGHKELLPYNQLVISLSKD